MTTTTRTLAESALGAVDAVDDRVAHEAVRSLLNVVGTAVGAARAAEVDTLVAGLRASGSGGDVRVPGREETLDPLSAALVVGFCAHLDDFDDTHLETVVHPAAAVLGALVGALDRTDATGAELVRAAAVGIELQLRVACAMSPSHYDAGWHITGTVGPLGAATAAGLVLGLDADQLGHALGIATSLALGHREGFGTMAKPFHPGKAAANGLLAASLARRGATASPTALEGARGYFPVMAPTIDPGRLHDGWGSTWELLSNTYKPYPCGIVSHPVIEAAEVLHEQVAGRDVEAVEVDCHPLVVELTGNPDPGDGLLARFSTIHGAAAGLLDGPVTLASYEDAYVRSEPVVAMRSRVRLAPSDTVPRDASRVRVVLADGQELMHEVEHVKGSLAAPLTEEQLDDKVEALLGRTVPGREALVIGATRDLGSSPSGREWLGTLAGGDR